MIAAPPTSDEAHRLKRLLGLGVLDSSRDAALDALAQRALLLFPGADSAAISFVGRDRVTFKACAGRIWQSVRREHSFCNHVIGGAGLMVVEDTWRDARFEANALVVGDPGIRFYAGAALLDGVGALCIIGLHPRLVTRTETLALQVLARTVDQRLSLHRAVHELTRQIPLG